MALILGGASFCAVAGDDAYCLTVARVAEIGALERYSDDQIKQGLCLTTKQAKQAAAANDKMKARLCNDAADSMTREFKKRFPAQPPEALLRDCPNGR